MRARRSRVRRLDPFSVDRKLDTLRSIFSNRRTNCYGIAAEFVDRVDSSLMQRYVTDPFFSAKIFAKNVFDIARRH